MWVHAATAGFQARKRDGEEKGLLASVCLCVFLSYLLFLTIAVHSSENKLLPSKAWAHNSRICCQYFSFFRQIQGRSIQDPPWKKPEIYGISGPGSGRIFIHKSYKLWIDLAIKITLRSDKKVCYICTFFESTIYRWDDDAFNKVSTQIESFGRQWNWSRRSILVGGEPSYLEM